jgi:Asp-tRNA(Asn)/Glu-tRNA(Gln) amidotransferase A subunit family amidase
MFSTTERVDLAYASATDVARSIRDGTLSPVEVMDNTLARIEEIQPRLNCFTGVWADDARAAARRAADAVSRGEQLGALHGVPIALKETTLIEGRPHTVGSVTHEHNVAGRDAAITRAMARAGAIVVGTTTSPEFAHTLVTESALWGTTRNPWDPRRGPGGSSGGSAAAVASGCVYLAEGSDMGGSVRIPASWCGIVGLKPGIGRIPMDVLPGLFDSISHHGPLARSVDDARLFLSVAQGPDDADIMSVTTPLDLSGPTPASVEGMRLGVSIDLGCWWVDPEIAAAVAGAAALLGEAGAVIEPVHPGFTADDEAMWMELWGVFMAAYYGDLVEEWGDRMAPAVLWLIEKGNSLSAAHVKRLEIRRTEFWHKVRRVLEGRSALLCPTMATRPVPASLADRVERRWTDGRYHSDEMTAVFNLVAPCPGLSVPCGFHAATDETAELPIGLQIIGHRWREDTVLQIGRAVELVLPEITSRRPPL